MPQATLLISKPFPVKYFIYAMFGILLFLAAAIRFAMYRERKRQEDLAAKAHVIAEQKRQEAIANAAAFRQILDAANSQLRAGNLEPACTLYNNALSMSGEFDKQEMSEVALATIRCKKVLSADLFPRMLGQLSDSEFRSYVEKGFQTIVVTGDPTFDAIATQRLVATGEKVYEFRAAGKKLVREEAQQAESKERDARAQADNAKYGAPWGRIYAGLVVYHRITHEKVFTILGGNDSMELPSGETIRAIVVEYPDGTVECKNRNWFIQDNSFVIRSDDPAITEMNWREFSRCPGFRY